MASLQFLFLGQVQVGKKAIDITRIVFNNIWERLKKVIHLPKQLIIGCAVKLITKVLIKPKRAHEQVQLQKGYSSTKFLCNKRGGSHQ